MYSADRRNQVESVILIVSVIWRKPVLTYAVTVSIDGLGEFGEKSLALALASDMCAQFGLGGACDGPLTSPSDQSTYTDSENPRTTGYKFAPELTPPWIVLVRLC